MKTIIVKVTLILCKEESERIEQQLRESINRQRGTGVIVLPNYVSYEGAIDERKCDNCYIAQNYNLEDDDTPCQNCGEDDDQTM